MMFKLLAVMFAFATLLTPGSAAPVDVDETVIAPKQNVDAQAIMIMGKPYLLIEAELESAEPVANDHFHIHIPHPHLPHIHINKCSDCQKLANYGIKYGASALGDYVDGVCGGGITGELCKVALEAVLKPLEKNLAEHHDAEKACHAVHLC